MSWHVDVTSSYGTLTDEEILENEELFLTQLIMSGFTLEAACGLMSNVYSESKMNPGVVGNFTGTTIPTCEQYQLETDKYMTAGFIQWQDPSGNGVQPLLKRAYDQGKTGYAWSSPVFQLSWLALNGGGKWQGGAAGIPWSEYKQMDDAQRCGELICEFLEGLTDPATIASRGLFAGALKLYWESHFFLSLPYIFILLLTRRKRR